MSRSRRKAPAQERVLDVDFELRSASDTGDSTGRRLEGYAAVFDTFTKIRSYEGNFDEKISKGAFAKSIASKFPVMQWDHGKDTRVGSVPIGVYSEISEDSHGLFVAGDLFDNPVVEPVRQAIEAEAVTGMSFAFQVIRDEWRDKSGRKITDKNQLRDLLYVTDSGLKRTITELLVREAGPVLFPAYQETSVGVRAEQIPTIPIAQLRRRMALIKLRNEGL